MWHGLGRTGLGVVVVVETTRGRCEPAEVDRGGAGPPPLPDVHRHVDAQQLSPPGLAPGADPVSLCPLCHSHCAGLSPDLPWGNPASYVGPQVAKLGDSAYLMHGCYQIFTHLCL